MQPRAGVCPIAVGGCTGKPQGVAGFLQAQADEVVELDEVGLDLAFALELYQRVVEGEQVVVSGRRDGREGVVELDASRSPPCFGRRSCARCRSGCGASPRRRRRRSAPVRPNCAQRRGTRGGDTPRARGRSAGACNRVARASLLAAGRRSSSYTSGSSLRARRRRCPVPPPAGFASGRPPGAKIYQIRVRRTALTDGADTAGPRLPLPVGSCRSVISWHYRKSDRRLPPKSFSSRSPKNESRPRSSKKTLERPGPRSRSSRW